MAARLGSNLGGQLSRAASSPKPRPTSTLPNLEQPSSPSFARRASGTSIANLRQEELREQENFQLSRQLTRSWKVGDVYAPHDLSGAEARKWRMRNRPTTDAFDALSLNPLTMYKNFSVMSEYMTEMGRIRHSQSTGLRPVNQRKIAKAIRRAISVGLMPSVHKHPEFLKAEMEGKKINTGRVFRS